MTQCITFNVNQTLYSPVRRITLMTIFSICLSFFPLQASANNKIVAEVNDEVVTQNQLNQLIQSTKQQYHAEGKAVSLQQIKKAALKQLIANKLQLQIAKQNKISASKEEVNQAIKHFASQNKLSLPAFKEALKKQGISYQTYQNFIKDRVTLEKLQLQVLRSKIKVTEQDIQNVMAQAKKMKVNVPVELLDLIISPKTEDEMKEARLAAKKISRLLNAGTTLEKAIEKTESPSITITQQDLGWRMPTALPDLFINAAQTVPTGQFSQPIKAPNGYHLLKILQRKGGVLSRQNAERAVFHKKLMLETQKWVEELKKNAYIVIK